MKYLELTLSSTAQAIHPIDRVISSVERVTRKALLHVDTRASGAVLLLYSLSGNRDAIAAALASHDAVRDSAVVATSDGFHAFIQTTPGGAGGALLEIAEAHALIIDTPLAFTPDGLVTTLVGTQENLQAALAAFPADLSVAVTDAGRYAGSNLEVLARLTDRQLEVFQVAIAEGYYEVPRQATREEIAARLGCATSTVDEHLRKAEAAIVSGLGP